MGAATLLLLSKGVQGLQSLDQVVVMAACCCLQVVNKAWLGAGCSHSSLRSYLEMLHSVYVLLHGPISTMLEQVSNHTWTMQLDINL
jgi:hypothetical protein